MSAQRIRGLIDKVSDDLACDAKVDTAILNELNSEFGAYVGRLKVLHPSHMELIDQTERYANSFYLDSMKPSPEKQEKMKLIHLWVQKISQTVEIGETLEKEQEKILPDYKELTNEIKKIREDYDTMDSLFEEFKGMKDDLKEIVDEHRRAKKGR